MCVYVWGVYICVYIVGTRVYAVANLKINYIRSQSRNSRVYFPDTCIGNTQFVLLTADGQHYCNTRWFHIGTRNISGTTGREEWSVC